MPTLWAGTNNGTVYVFTISVPAGNKRSEEAVTCQLGKSDYVIVITFFVNKREN